LASTLPNGPDAPSESKALRALPSVNRLLEWLPDLEHEPARAAARQVLDAERRAILEGGISAPADIRVLAGRCRSLAARRAAPSLRRVINATGVLLHTNLGRAPLAEAALEAVSMALSQYTNLELDLETGERGSRQNHVAGLLCELTGAEAAMVVNNNAAAVLLVLAGLCRGREAVVSRGELVEIGGGFRVPEVMAESGARLREVGTTNRTHLADYERALGPETGLVVKVHRSNFALVGHTAEVELAELAALGRRAGVSVYYDAGSGALCGLPGHQPDLRELIATGVDVLTASGDKTLGGPQAGIVLAGAKLIGRLHTHPLARAMRADKSTIAALEATLRLYRDGHETRVPLVRMVRAGADELERAARGLAAAQGWKRLRPDVVCSEAQLGGGSDPRAAMPSFAVVLCADGFEGGELRRRLLEGDPPVVARVADGSCLLDLRSVLPEDRETLTACVAALDARLDAVQRA
jgi:L-seryl-tRNA(Ser) seleniumtransferase